MLVPRLIGRLAIEAPNVRLVVRPSDFRTLLDRLDAGDADVALSATPTRGLERRHRVEALYDETFAVLYDPARLGKTGPLDLATYLATPHALLSIDGNLRGAIDDRLARLGHSRRVIVAVSHFPTMPFILRRHEMLANVPATAARHFARAYGLEVGPPPFDAGRFGVSLIWHVRTDTDPAHAWFRTTVAEEIRGLLHQSGVFYGRADTVED